MQGEILTARPEGMDFHVYRSKLRDQKLMLRDRLRYGFMVWKSKSIDAVNGESWGTLVGPVPRLIFVK